MSEWPKELTIWFWLSTIATFTGLGILYLTNNPIGNHFFSIGFGAMTSTIVIRLYHDHKNKKLKVD